MARQALHRHSLLSRWTHWVNFPVLAIMVWSGLRIYWADLRDPYGLGIGAWHWITLFPDGFNEALGLERRLARGMAFHFTFGWFFTLNGLLFVGYGIISGSWRKLVPTRSELRAIPRELRDELNPLRRPGSAHGYNAIQKLSYLGVLGLGFLVVISGLAIFAPTQLQWLTAALGGYESSRTIHFASTMGFVVFFAVHVLQVIRAGWSTFASMITGYHLTGSKDPA